MNLFQTKLTTRYGWYFILLILCLFVWQGEQKAQATPAGLTPVMWSAIQEIQPGDYLKASNPGLMSEFGGAVALDGNTLVVGAMNEDSNATGVNGNQQDTSAPASGAAYVFVYEDGQWHQEAYLKASNTNAGDSFGCDVAISGDTIVVGAFAEDSNATGVNGDQTDNSLFNAGAAYVFTRTDGQWSQQAYLKASNPGEEDIFGLRVAISGDTIVAGAPWEDSNAVGVNGDGANNLAIGSGAAYVFTRSAGQWSQQAYLKASNTEQLDTFGASLAISNNTIVVGATAEDSDSIGVNGNQTNNIAIDSGAAYVFTHTAGQWSQQAYLKASNTENLGEGLGDNFGAAVQIDEDTLVVGAYNEDSGATGVNGNQNDNTIFSSGAAYVFTRTAGQWSQQAYLKASNPGFFNYFGNYLGLSGDVIAVGAFGEESNATGVNGNQLDESLIHAGAVYLFTRTDGVWSQQAYLKPFSTDFGDAFGMASIGVSDQFVVVGSIGEDGSASGVNGDFTDNSLTNAGAVYTYIQPIPHTLNLSTVGLGSVVSDPAGLNCGLTCTVSLMTGEVVTLTATAETGSTFIGWSGSITSTTNPLTITMSADLTLVATFAPEETESYSLFLPLLALPPAGDKK